MKIKSIILLSTLLFSHLAVADSARYTVEFKAGAVNSYRKTTDTYNKNWDKEVSIALAPELAKFWECKRSAVESIRNGRYRAGISCQHRGGGIIFVMARCYGMAQDEDLQLINLSVNGSNDVATLGISCQTKKG